jgi:hypothetical protein
VACFEDVRENGVDIGLKLVKDAPFLRKDRVKSTSLEACSSLNWLNQLMKLFSTKLSRRSKMWFRIDSDRILMSASRMLVSTVLFRAVAELFLDQEAVPHDRVLLQHFVVLQIHLQLFGFKSNIRKFSSSA